MSNVLKFEKKPGMKIKLKPGQQFTMPDGTVVTNPSDRLMTVYVNTNAAKTNDIKEDFEEVGLRLVA
jgi:hypothetical protein